MALHYKKLSTDKLDKAGAVASFLCAIHCAIMPLLLTLLPLMALSVFASETFEWILFGASALLGVTSTCFGYKLHKSRKAIAVLSCGLALLATGRLLHQHNHHDHAPLLTAEASDQGHDHSHPDTYTIFLVSGGLIVALSHVINHRLCKSCKKCSVQK
jgi:hypothetical protein